MFKLAATTNDLNLAVK